MIWTERTGSGDQQTQGKEELLESSPNKLKDEMKSLNQTTKELNKEIEQYNQPPKLHKRIVDL